MDIFLMLDLINWEIDSLEKEIEVYKKYHFDMIGISLKKIRNDKSYLGYFLRKNLEYRKIIEKSLIDLKKLEYILQNKKILGNRLRQYIINKSRLNSTEINKIYEIYNIPFRLQDGINKNIFIRENKGYRLNPELSFIFEQDMIDFVKYYINLSFNLERLAIDEAYHRYELSSLTKDNICGII